MQSWGTEKPTGGDLYFPVSGRTELQKRREGWRKVKSPLLPPSLIRGSCVLGFLTESSDGLSFCICGTDEPVLARPPGTVLNPPPPPRYRSQRYIIYTLNTQFIINTCHSHFLGPSVWCKREHTMGSFSGGGRDYTVAPIWRPQSTAINRCQWAEIGYLAEEPTVDRLFLPSSRDAT